MAIDPRIPLAVTPPEWNPLSFMEQLDRSRSSRLLQDNQKVQNDLQKTAYADNMLARAADQGKDSPEAWDQGMSALAQAGVPGAAEQVGKWSRPYAEQFAQRGRMTNQGYAQQQANAAAAPRGQQPQGAGGQPDPFGAKSNEEVAKNLEGVQMMLQPLAGGAVRNKRDLDTLVDEVVAAGHPEAARFKGMFTDGPLFNEQVKGLYEKLKQTADAAQERLSAGGVGAPPEPQPSYSTTVSEAGPIIQTSPLGGGKPTFEFAPMGGSPNDAFQPKTGAASGVGVEASLSPAALRTMAEQYLAGDKTVFQNLGRGAQGSANIVALRESVAQVAKERGLVGQDLANIMAKFEGVKAGYRTIGTRSGAVLMAATEAGLMGDLVIETSNNVDRTEFPSLNAISEAVRRGTGDENIIRFNTALNSFINVYARAIAPSGQGPTVSDKEHAREMLETAFSKGQVNAAIETMLREVELAKETPGQVKDSFGRQFMGDGTDSGHGEKKPVAKPSWAP